MLFLIIHTKISPDYPYKEISGGFVAYKLASALLKKHDKYLFHWQLLQQFLI